MKKRKYRWSFWLLCLLVLGAFAAPLQPLPLEQAMPLTVWSPSPQTIIVQWNIQPGFYLYKDRIQISPVGNEIQLGELSFPPANEHNNAILGPFSAYDDRVQIQVPVLSSSGSEVVLQVKYQGCAKQGYCYPPQTREIKVELGAGNSVQNPTALGVDRIPQTHSVKQWLQAPGEALTQHHYQWPVWLGFFGFGLLISLTPCVLPMIPIVSSLIISKNPMSHGRAFFISLSYVMGMAFTYAIAGVLFGWLGGNVQTYMQKPWIIMVFSLIFMAMALSLWGVYSLQPPQKLRAWVAGLSHRQRGGSIAGALMMGSLSTLILSPCATPPLIAVLSYISQTGHASLGGLALFVIGLGSGTPLLLIGAFGRRILPKAGIWMNGVESLLGFVLAGMAIELLSRVLPDAMTLVLWAALLTGCAIYLKAFSSVTTRLQLVGKGAGILIFVYAIFLLSHLPTNLRLANAPADRLNFIPVKTLAEVQQQLKQAAGKPVVIDFYADWCVSCKLLERRVFSNPQVQKSLSEFLLLRADITKNNADDKILMANFNVIAPPSVIILDASHQEVSQSRVIGLISPAEFLKRLNTLLKSG